MAKSANTEADDALEMRWDGPWVDEPGGALASVLRESAVRNANRSNELRDHGVEIRKGLSARDALDASRVGLSVRLLIVIGWAFFAFQFDRAAVNAKLADVDVTAGGIPVADADAISDLFIQVSGFGIVGVLLMSLLISFQNQQVTRMAQASAQAFGRSFAEMLKSLDTKLQAHRAALADSTQLNEAIATEVSDAHMTAQEAMLLFKEVDFLTGPRVQESEEQIQYALDDYARYLLFCRPVSDSELPKATRRGLTLGFFLGTFIGAFIGFIATVRRFGPPPDELLKQLEQDLGLMSQYTEMTLLFVFSAVLYLFATVFFGGLAGPIFTGERRKQLRESLNEIRGAVIGAEAPRPADIAQRVEDLNAIFKVRLRGGDTAGRGKINAGVRPVDTPSLASDDDEPAWRRKPEAPRFVDMAFSSSPKPWLEGKKPATNAPTRSPNPAAKRDRFRP
ncbi:MAG: hypothetical protein AAF850_12880 [Pseudomonadota bacterium]